MKNMTSIKIKKNLHTLLDKPHLKNVLISIYVHTPFSPRYKDILYKYLDTIIFNFIILL